MTITDNNNIDDNSNNAFAGTSVSTLNKLPDAQVFSRDPEAYTEESLADTIERLRKIMVRQRKARADDEQVAAAAAAIKKTNAAAKRAKARTKASEDPMENTI
jgi:hypothetical protein